MQLEAPSAAWVEDSYLLPQLGPSHADGKLEVRVVGYNDGHLVVILEAVHQQIGCQIDIGALLFGVEYFNRPRAAHRLVRQRPPLSFGEQVPVVHGYSRYGLQGTKVSLLSLGLGWVPGAAGNQRGKVADPAYVVLGQQKPYQLPDVQPSVRRAPQGAVVQVEAVYIDVGAYGGLPYKKLRLPCGSLAPCRRSGQGVYVPTIPGSRSGCQPGLLAASLQGTGKRLVGGRVGTMS